MTTKVNKLTRRIGMTSALAASVTFMLALLVGSVAFFIWHDHRDAVKNAAQRTGQAARTIEEHTSLSLRAAENLLDRAAERLIAGADRRELDGLARSLLQVRSLWYLDMKSDLIYTSAGPGLTGNHADREYFRYSSQHDGAYIGPLTRGGPEHDDFFILSKRVSVSGAPVGVILAEIGIGYWSKFHASLGLDPDSVIAVFRNDGRFIARNPMHERAFNTNVSQTPFFLQARPAERAGVFFDTTSSTDGVTRIVAYRPIPEYGLFVVASESHKAMLAGWRRRAEWAVVLGGTAVLLVAGLAILTWRFARLEGQAREALAGKAAELERALDVARLLHRELQHRTKNNLQLITSLLRVGLRGNDPAEAMNAAIARVTAISRAYTDVPGTSVDRAQCRTIIGDTVHALTSGLRPDQLKVDLDLADCWIPVERAAPLALIVNEAVTNAIKHGVSAEAPSHIGVSAKIADATLKVEVRDRGPGMSPSSSRAGSSGLKIIDGLARQIHATYAFENDGGTVFRLRMALDTGKSAAP